MRRLQAAGALVTQEERLIFLPGGCSRRARRGELKIAAESESWNVAVVVGARLSGDPY